MKNKFGQPIELLAPAGDMSRLKTAFHFGADAVYLGGKEFGLRAKCRNFTEAEISQAVEFAKRIGKKIYVAVNIFANNADFPEIEKYALFLEKVGVDAVIVSDLGVLSVFKKHTNLEIHISTQANILNQYSAMQYVELGAKRIILARELPISDIADICQCLHGKADIEVFVHGAMCIAYSGRCLLSNYMTGRSSNRGDCAQPCRYKYTLQEEKRPEEFFPIEEDRHGTYIMNSRDLVLINHIKELADAGVRSFKIEGRMKNECYVGGVVNVYRRAMNGEKFDYMHELSKIPHRPFTTGFVFGDQEKEFFLSSAIIQNFKIVGVSKGGGEVLVKNKIKPNDEIEILSPSETNGKKFEYKGDIANVPETVIQIDCPYPLQPCDLLRKARVL